MSRGESRRGMNVIDLLRQRFTSPSAHRHIVIWHDPDGDADVQELQAALADLGVKVWEWTRDNSFRTKYQLEIADPHTPYLVYARFPKPSVHEDWLLDIRLYGDEFVADRTALCLQEFGITHPAAREFVSAHLAFFRSQERVRKVQRLLPERPSPKQLVLATLAAATGAEAPDVMRIVRQVLAAGLDEDVNPPYQQLAKWRLTASFWNEVREVFGFPPETLTLRQLFYAVAASHLAHGVDAELPSEWGVLRSETPNTCRIFLDDTLRSPDGAAFAAHLRQFSADLGVTAWLAQLPYDRYVRCDTVPETHQLLLRHLCEQLIHEVADSARWLDILSERRNTHGYETWRHAYAALEIALSLQQEKQRFAEESSPSDPKAWFDGYVARWYRIDQLYRRFSSESAKVDEALLEPLATLRERWDNWYSHVFLPACGEWTDHLLRQGWADAWPIPGVPQQRQFYAQYVAPHTARERVFVLVSDALRYEAGEELATRLNGRLQGQVELTAMQASLPTYTRLGMASLLPGRAISMNGSGAVLRDGRPTDSLEARGDILSAHADGAVALRWSDFDALTVQQGEAVIRGKRVIYLYHDVIDAIGDQSRSETRTFAAVQQAIDELEAAVHKLARSYRAVRIVVTADHGFLFQPLAVEAWAKPDPVTGHVYDGNRRFAVGRDLSAPAGSHRVSLAYLGLDVEAVIAASVYRFTGHGGMRFVHGGAMPQEAIVPVIVYHPNRSQARGLLPYVDVALVNRGRVVTSYEFTAILFQEQKAGVDYQPRHLRIGLYWDGMRISTEVTRTFDLQGDPPEREVRVPLHLFEREYPLGAIAKLRLEDVSGPETTLYREYDVELRIAP
jgi:uncharacterized protein (TIGR02687 family)